MYAKPPPVLQCPYSQPAKLLHKDAPYHQNLYVDSTSSLKPKPSNQINSIYLASQPSLHHWIQISNPHLKTPTVAQMRISSSFITLLSPAGGGRLRGSCSIEAYNIFFIA